MSCVLHFLFISFRLNELIFMNEALVFLPLCLLYCSSSIRLRCLINCGLHRRIFEPIWTIFVNGFRKNTILFWVHRSMLISCTIESGRFYLENYWDLYRWSIKNLSKFWEEFWYYIDVKHSTPFEKVRSSESFLSSSSSIDDHR